MRYIVVVHRGVPAEEMMGPEEAESQGVGPDDVLETVVERVVLCEDSRAVAKAIRECDAERGEEWAGLFEVMPGGRTRSRAVVRKMDGECLYDVEIS